MVDPGWAGTWHYAVPAPAAIIRRWKWLQAPSRLQQLRGLAIMAAFVALVFGIGGALLIVWRGRVRFWERGSGQLVLLGLVLVAVVVPSIAVQWRSRRKASSLAEHRMARWALPQQVGLGMLFTGFLVGFVSGWWIAPVLGAVALFIGLAAGVPTTRRVLEAEREAKEIGESVLEHLLSAPER